MYLILKFWRSWHVVSLFITYVTVTPGTSGKIF